MSQIFKPVHHTQQWRLNPFMTEAKSMDYMITTYVIRLKLKRKKTVKIMKAVPLNLIIFLFIILFIIYY